MRTLVAAWAVLLVNGCDCGSDIHGPGPGSDAGADGSTGHDGGACDCTAPEQCIGGRCRTPHGPCSGASDCTGDDHCLEEQCVDWGDGEYGRDCTREAEPGRVRPELQCAWAGPPAGGPRETAVAVMHTPLALHFHLPEDPDSPQGPMLVFASDDSYHESVPRICESHGILRIVDGATCEERFELADDADRVDATVTPAIAELDGVGPPEIVAAAADGGLVAFAFDAAAGRFVRRWHSTEPDGSESLLGSDTCLWGGVSVHDLDDDGSPEILFHGGVHDADGVHRASWPYQHLTWGNPAVAADVDLDGRPEIVEAYGTWEYAAGVLTADAEWVGPGGTNGFVAVADFGDFAGAAGDAPGRAEVVVAGNGEVRLQTVAGAVVWQRAGFRTGGPPTVADFDGDGRPEIGVAFGDEYVVFDLDCAGAPIGCAADGVLWRSPSQDLSSARTGSSVFDFNGDGRAEVVYGDECFLRVYDGPTGEVVFSQGRFSSTWHENAIVADVDGDFSAEIVLPASSSCMPGYCPAWDPSFAGLACDGDADCPGGPCTEGRCRCADDAECGSDFGCDAGTCRTRHEDCAAGVRVYRDALDRWAASRPVWNQHAYAVTNVGDDGTIPRSSEWARNWEDGTLNDFRQNVQGSVGPVPAPDLTVRLGEPTCAPDGTVTLVAEVCNRGAARVDAGVGVELRDGGPAGALLCAAETPELLDPGHCVTVTCEPASAPAGAPWAAVDVAGARAECEEGNNGAAGDDVVCVQ